MKQLKIVKRQIKKQGFWKEYKKKFKNKQIRLGVSKIIISFEPKISTKKLASWEISLLKENKDEHMYKNVFNEFTKLSESKVNWKNFYKIMWFAYQTSTYFYDKRKKIENIYINQNIIKLNSIKKNYYADWLDSIDKTDKYFNKKIIQVLKVIV